MHYESHIREPLILGDKNYHDVTVEVARPIETAPPRSWWIAFSISLLLFLWGVGNILYTIGTGIGTWGLNKTVGWAWDITNFVWWVGIGHAGTLISAVLLLFRQKWRMSINRSAEAMTIFSVIQAALFPGIHMGRIWLAYFVFPIPNQFGSLWVNFNSPLLWDVFAISTYFSVSVVFWYVGLIPDFAMLIDRAIKPVQKHVYSILSFGGEERLNIGSVSKKFLLFLRAWLLHWLSRYTLLYLWTSPRRLYQVGIQLYSRLILLRVLYSLGLRWYKHFS